MSTLETTLDGAAPSVALGEVLHMDVEELATAEHPERARRLKLFFQISTAVAAAGIVVLVVVGVTSGVLTSVESLRGFLGQFGVLAPAAFVVAGALEAVVPVIPGSGTVISAPVLFGPVAGVIYAYLATCLGSLIVFGIARVLGRDLIVARFPRKVIERYAKWLDHPKFTKYFAAAIAAPLAPDDALCYLAGVTSLKWRTYLVIILLCKPWGILLYTTGVMALLKVVFPWMEL